MKGGGTAAENMSGLLSMLSCSPKSGRFTRCVWAKELTAYKAVAGAITSSGDTVYVSIWDGATRYILGQEMQDSGRGFFVYLDPKHAVVRTARPSRLMRGTSPFSLPLTVPPLPSPQQPNLPRPGGRGADCRPPF